MLTRLFLVAFGLIFSSDPAHAWLCKDVWAPQSGLFCPKCATEASPWENSWRGGGGICISCDNPCPVETGIPAGPDQDDREGCDGFTIGGAQDSMFAALRVDDDQFDELAGRAPTIAEVITWISAVPGGKGGPFDLRAFDAMSMGKPSYERAWKARRETSVETATESVVMPDVVTAIKSVGFPVPQQHGAFWLTLAAFRSAVPGTASGEVVERVNLLLMSTRDRFYSSTTDDSVQIYEVIDIEFPAFSSN